jgi:hypothetical protein
MRTFAFAGLVLAAVAVASVASADLNNPTAHVTVRRATSNCKDPGSGPPPPNTGFQCSYASPNIDKALVLNTPVEADLPDGRKLQLVFTGTDGKGRIKVNALSKKPGGSSYVLFANISARPDEVLGVNFPYAGSPNDALFLEIKMN